MSRMFYTPDEVARLLKLSKGTVYRLVRDKVIKAVRLNRVIRIPKQEIERLAGTPELADTGGQ